MSKFQRSMVILNVLWFAMIITLVLFGDSERTKRIELEAALVDCQWFLSAQIDRAIGGDHVDSSQMSDIDTTIIYDSKEDNND